VMLAVSTKMWMLTRALRRALLLSSSRRGRRYPLRLRPRPNPNRPALAFRCVAHALQRADRKK